MYKVYLKMCNMCFLYHCEWRAAFQSHNLEPQPYFFFINVRTKAFFFYVSDPVVRLVIAPLVDINSEMFSLRFKHDCRMIHSTLAKTHMFCQHQTVTYQTIFANASAYNSNKCSKKHFYAFLSEIELFQSKQIKGVKIRNSCREVP